MAFFPVYRPGTDSFIMWKIWPGQVIRIHSADCVGCRRLKAKEQGETKDFGVNKLQVNCAYPNLLSVGEIAAHLSYLSIILGGGDTPTNEISATRRQIGRYTTYI